MKKSLYLLLNAFFAIGGSLLILLLTFSITSSLDEYNLLSLVTALGALYIMQSILMIVILLFNIIYWSVSGLIQEKKRKTLFIIGSLILLIINVILGFLPFFVFSAYDYSSLLTSSIMTNVIWYFLNPLLIFLIFLFIILSTNVSGRSKTVKIILMFFAIFIINTVAQGMTQFLAVPTQSGILEILTNLKETFSHILSTMIVGMTIKNLLIVLVASIFVAPFGEKKESIVKQEVKTKKHGNKVRTITSECDHEVIEFKNRRSLKMSARARNELYIEKAELKNKKLKKIKRLNKAKYGL